MRPMSLERVLDILEAFAPSTALGAALELGLFWLLKAEPRGADAVARELGIPSLRCLYWLEVLRDLGLLECSDGAYRPSPEARVSILQTYGQATWAFLALEARERQPLFCDLPRGLRAIGARRDVRQPDLPVYVAKMVEDPGRARQFTRMLYELHRPLAEELARSLDLGGVSRLMDLGGGSGVLSLTLLRQYPALRAVVVDLATVCAAGREIAAETPLADRIAYHPADLLRDSLPSGFDMAIECDVNVYSKELFRKVRDSLNPGGRFVIIDQLAPAAGAAPTERTSWALERALVNPEFEFPTAIHIRALLRDAGFRIPSEDAPASTAEAGPPAMEAWTVIKARK